jgi:hypothetical protein
MATISDNEHFEIEWIDSGREPKCKPDPAYPDGVDLDVVRDRVVPSCLITLPYPAKRCGRYLLECRLCGLTAVCTTAGRPDDPRSIKLACRMDF